MAATGGKPPAEMEFIIRGVTLDSITRLEIPPIYGPVVAVRLVQVIIQNPRKIDLLDHRVHFIDMIDCTIPQVHLQPWIVEMIVHYSCTAEIVINEWQQFNTTLLQSRHNPITSIPININRLILLQDLEFMKANFPTLNFSVLNDMNHLQSLRLSSCNISNVLDNTSVVLPSLEVLHLQHNQITHLDTHRWNLPELYYLILSDNHLSELPQLNQFRKLKLVDLSENFLQTFNLQQVAGLERLLSINLSYNRILHLDASEPIHLPALTDIQLDHNLLRRLNLSTWHVPMLRQLGICANRLQKIDGIESLPGRMREIGFRDNPWDCNWLRNVSVSRNGTIDISSASSCASN